MPKRKRSSTGCRKSKPSRATKTDVEGLGIPAERVTMIRHGAPALDRARVAPVPTLEQRVRGSFLLALGAPSKKKGSDLLLNAWRAVAATMSCLLVWVGGGPELNGPSVVALPPQDDRRSRWLYEHAAAVVVPSRWEGYSFAVAEGMTLGVPVIASDIPVHREFGEGPHLFSLDAPEELEELLVAASKGHLTCRTTEFPTWSSVALAHERVYRELGVQAAD